MIAPIHGIPLAGDRTETARFGGMTAQELLKKGCIQQDVKLISRCAEEMRLKPIRRRMIVPTTILPGQTPEGEQGIMEFKVKSCDAFRKSNDRGARVTAGAIAHYNTVTIAWGSMGTVWGSSRPMFVGEIADGIER